MTVNEGAGRRAGPPQARPDPLGGSIAAPGDRGAAILAGLRVIDLATGHAGSAAALYLGEAGAEVIKIEAPGAQANDEPTLLSVLNRGKRSVVLDLLQPEGQLEALIASADVLIHDLTPQAAAGRGLDDKMLAARHPRLIVSAIGGWPQRHVLAESKVDELLVLARLGILDEQPGHRPGPVYIRLPFANWIASWLSAVGIMARLIARDRDQRGGVAHTSLAQAALVPMTMHWSRAERPSPVFAKGLDKSTPIPLHLCADGRWIHVHYSPDKSPWMAEALAAMGPEAVAAENAKYPPSHVAPNFGANKKIIATRPAQQWVEHFWAHDVSAQIAVAFGEIYKDEQARANGYVVMVDDERLGRVSQPGIAYQVAPPARVRGGRQAVGQDTAAVLGGVSGNTPAAMGDGAAAPVRAEPFDGAPPLHGLKVLDLGAYLAGPFACMVLSDLGADVIKVEPPTGDAMRRLERAFAGTQRGKRGLALRLGDEGSKPVMDSLLRWADIVQHNIRLPAARKLGIGYEQVRALNPSVVYGHVSSYGHTGARADWPGFDQLMQASCGWEVECGGEGNPPMWLRFGVGDHLAALSCVFAMLLAHYRRGRAGEGQSVSSSLLGAMLLTAGEVVLRSDGSTTPMPHLDAAQTGLSPHRRLYRCADGWIAVAATAVHEQQAFDALAGADAELHFTGLPVARALAALKAAGVPAEPALESQTQAFLDSPEHAAAGLHAHYPHAAYGDLQQIGALWDFGDLPLSLKRPPPALGEHSREVLAELGWAEADIERLAAQGLTRLGPQGIDRSPQPEKTHG